MDGRDALRALVGRERSRRPRYGALRIALAFSSVGAAWILGSDALLGHLALSPRQAAAFEVGKGLLFVVVASTILFFVARRELRLRRAVERDLAEAHAALLTVINAAPLPIVAFDPGGRVELWNPSAERTFGWAAAEVIGRIVPFTGRDRAELEANLDRVRRGESIRGARMKRHAKNGRELDLVLWTAPMHGPDGELCGVMALYEDITDRTRAEAELKRSEERLFQFQKMEAIGRLAGGLAHDLNNLLTAVIGFNELVLEQTPPDDPRHASAAEIGHAAQRAAGLTRQLLAFSRKQVLQPTTFDLSDVVLGLTPMLRRLIGEDIAIDVRRAPDALPVRADRAQLEQVLLNLALNARDAMPDGGTLIITTAAATAPAGQPATDGGRGRWVRLRVQDSGLGIPDEIRSHLFEPYFTTKENGKGTGLGLSTVFGIVAQSGGSIDVTSVPGQGSRFDVYLPACSETPGPAPAGEDEPTLATGTESVLVVEDEDALRELVVRVLTARGFQVTEAGDADRALALAADPARPIDVLVTDIVMPGMNGWQLAERLAAQRPTLRVVFVSGYADGAPEAAGLPDGAGFLAKPFTPTALVRAVRDALDA